jgi:tetratricopeptide (TPR) repeat protein
MFNVHPDREQLERFMLGDLSPEETRAVLQHLLSDCKRCQASTRAMWDLGLDAKADDDEPAAEAEVTASAPGSWWAASDRFDYDVALDRVFDRVRRVNNALQRERTEAPQLLAELTRHPVERQRLLVQNSLRFQSWGLCELLLAQPIPALSGPREGHDLGEVAVTLAQSLDAGVYGAPLLEDIQARAWCYLANARRLLADLRGAELAFQAAESHLAHGTGERLERARLLDLKASLRTNQGRYGEAIGLLNRAAAIYQRAQQRHLLGRVLLNKGHVCIWSGDHETATALLRQGLALVEPERDPKLVAIAYHNLAYVLNEMGQPREALALVTRARLLYLELGDRYHLTRLQFTEGKIALNLGRLDQAEGMLREVRRSFVETGMVHDAALASLDLAQVYAQQGRHAEIRVLSEELLPICQSRDLRREALAALILFRQAAEAGAVTLALAQEVSAQLHKLRHEAADGAAF